MLLGGSWVVISGVIGKVTILITLIRGLITPLITTHELPRRRHVGNTGSSQQIPTVNLLVCRVPVKFHSRVYNKNLQKSRVWWF